MVLLLIGQSRHRTKCSIRLDFSRCHHQPEETLRMVAHNQGLVQGFGLRCNTFASPPPDFSSLSCCHPVSPALSSSSHSSTLLLPGSPSFSSGHCPFSAQMRDPCPCTEEPHPHCGGTDSSCTPQVFLISHFLSKLFRFTLVGDDCDGNLLLFFLAGAHVYSSCMFMAPKMPESEFNSPARRCESSIQVCPPYTETGVYSLET